MLTTVLSFERTSELCLVCCAALCYVVQVQPVSPDVDAALHAWRDKTPALAAIKGTATGSGGDKGATSKKKSGKDDPKGSKSKKK